MIVIHKMAIMHSMTSLLS